MNPFEFPTDIADRKVFARAVAALRDGGVLLRDFLSEWNNHVYFRVKKIPQAIKD